MTGTPLPKVEGAQIERTRREHKLSPSVLGMLAGLSEAQIESIERDSDAAFVNDAHRIDCARRIAVALGLPRDHFLRAAPDDAPGAAHAGDSDPGAARDVPVHRSVPREQWQHLPPAALTLLAPLRSCRLPPAPVDQRRGATPMPVALVLCIVLSGLMLTLALLR